MSADGLQIWFTIKNRHRRVIQFITMWLIWPWTHWEVCCISNVALYSLPTEIPNIKMIMTSSQSMLLWITLFSCNRHNLCQVFVLNIKYGVGCVSIQSPCNSDPCQHNGTCVDSDIAGTYRCDCTSDFYGAHCESGINAVGLLMNYLILSTWWWWWWWWWWTNN